MTVRPIIFSAHMVRALLDGRKSQTRRLATSPLRKCEVGDRLWVREGWACHWSTDDQAPREIDAELWSVRYLADDQIKPAARDGSLATLDQCRRGRPSVFMPRWASRLTLTVTDVRVQRVQDISEDDAAAEGIIFNDGSETGESWRKYVPWRAHSTGNYCSCRRSAFEELWNSLHAKPGERWKDDPLVTAISFTVEQRNIDA